MSEPVLQLWEFAKAPVKLRRLVPLEQTEGWLAFIRPGETGAIVEQLISHWNSAGVTIIRHENKNGEIVIAGPHLQQAGLDVMSPPLDTRCSDESPFPPRKTNSPC